MNNNKKKYLVLGSSLFVLILFLVVMRFTNAVASSPYIPNDNPLGEGVKNVYLVNLDDNVSADNSKYLNLITYIDKNQNVTADIFMDTFVISGSSLDDRMTVVTSINDKISEINTANNTNIKINILMGLDVFQDDSRINAFANLSDEIKSQIENEIDDIITRFDNNYSNLNFIGFYWTPENINIANSIKYIFNYADKMGLPAVINMSLGSNDGAHDGTSTLCCLFNEMTGPGRICVVSAGNDGHIPMNIRKQLSDNDSLATFISNWTSREPLRGYTSMWSQSPNRHTVDIVIWDIKSDTIVHRLDIPRDAATDSVYIVSSETDSIFAKYFTGALYFACAIESNGNFHSLVEVDYTSTDKSKYRIGLINKAPSGETLMGWSGGKIVFSSSGLSSWVGGVAGGCCISDLATTDSVISVGAYCSNNSFVMMSGDTLTVSRCYPYDIAYFSSFGPDALNKPRPDVVAPGYQVASSVSRYVSAYQDPAIVVDNVIVNGVEYPYGRAGGTSMSTPVVTGAIALWLEINKSLSPSNIREILQATCYKDSYVENGVPKKWGYGKLDIDAGIKYLLEKLNGDVNCDGEVNSSDITCLYNILLGISNDHISRGDVNADGSITSSDITFLYSNILGF